jgi:hypothetical protein
MFTLFVQLVQAMTLFKAEDKDNKSFQFLHRWNLLHNQPKWHEKRKQMADQKQGKRQMEIQVREHAIPSMLTVATMLSAIMGLQKLMFGSDQWIRRRPKKHCCKVGVILAWKLWIICGQK